MGLDWERIGTAALGALANWYQARGERRAADQANRQNQEQWERGYWTMRSPYMESMIAPQLMGLLTGTQNLMTQRLGHLGVKPGDPSMLAHMYLGMGGSGFGPGGPGAAQTASEPTGPNAHGGPMHGHETIRDTTFGSHGSTVHNTPTIGQGLGPGDMNFALWLGRHPWLARGMGAAGDALTGGTGAFEQMIRHFTIKPEDLASHDSIDRFMQTMGMGGAGEGLQSHQGSQLTHDANGNITGSGRQWDSGAMNADDITGANIANEYNRLFGHGNTGSVYYGGGGGGGLDSLNWYNATQPSAYSY